MTQRAVSNIFSHQSSVVTLAALAACVFFTAAAPSAAQQTVGATPEAQILPPVILGGIGAGCIRVSRDGSIGQATINNNWYRPTGELPGCFGAISVHSGNQTASRVVSLHSAYGLPTAAAIDFDGAFPQATLHCAAGSFPDADVTLRAFSPFIPGDVRNSSMPAAAFVFHVVNRSGSPITVSVALSWEDSLGVGQTPNGDAFENRSGDAVNSIPDLDGFFGLRFTGPERANGSAAAEDGASGDMTLMAYPYRSNAVVTTAGWNSLDVKPAWWDSFASVGLVSGTAPVGVTGKSHPAGVVAVQFVLKPREAIDVPMCVSWFAPVMRSATGEVYGHYYQDVFPDSAHAARALLGDWQSLLALTEEWQKRITSSSMPSDIDRRLLNSVGTLVTNTVFVRNGRFTFLPDLNSDSTAQGETYLRQRRTAADLLLALFPQLYAQEMVNLLSARIKEGAFPSESQDWPGRIGSVSTPGELAEPSDGNPIDLPGAEPPSKDVVVRIDAAALADSSEYVVQADKFVAATNDLEFLSQAIRSIRSVVMAFQSQDAITRVPLSNGSGTTHKTPDSVLVDWLSLLRSARRLAEIAESHAFEWAAPAGPLGSAPGGLMEVAAEQHFVSICDTEIAKVEAELLKRGVLPSTELHGLNRSAIERPTDIGGLKQAADWDLLSSVEGYTISLQSGELNLSTPIPGAWRSLTAPVFSATFVGRTEFKPTAHGGLLTLRIDRTITLSPMRSYRHRAGATGGPQIIIRTLRIAGPPPTVVSGDSGAQIVLPGSINVRVSLGPNPIGCTVIREPSGILLLTFASPLTLLTGDMLQVDVH